MKMAIKSISLDTIQGYMITGMAWVLPLIVLPDIVDNEFETPKRFVFLTGALSLALLYGFQFFIQKRAGFPKTATPWMLSLVCFLIACNFFYTQNLYYTIDAAVLYVAALAIFFCISISTTSRSANWLFFSVGIVGAIVASICILQSGKHFMLFGYDFAIGIIPGTIGNSNSLGAFLIFPALILTGSLALVQKMRRLLSVALLYVVLMGLYISRARASWIGFLAAVTVLLFFMVRINADSSYLRSLTPRKMMLSTGLVGGFIGCFFLMTMLVPGSWQPWLKLKSITDQRSLVIRMKIANASFRLWRSNNLWTGTGIGSFRNRVYDVQSAIAQENPRFFDGYGTPNPRHVHNEYLEVLNDGGLIAALGLLLLVGNVMRHGYMLIADPEVSKDCRMIAAIAFSSIVGVLLIAIFYFPLRITTTLFMTVLMLGIIEGLYARYHSRVAFHGPPHGAIFVLIGFIFCAASVSVFYHAAYKPLNAERAHAGFTIALGRGDIPLAEAYLQTALFDSPFNTLYCFDAANFYMDVKKDFFRADVYIDRAIFHFNGDISRWGLHFVKGLLNERLHRPEAARRELVKAIQYYPPFDAAKNELAHLNKAIERAKISLVVK